MNTTQQLPRSRPDNAEKRLKELGIHLPTPPEPFGIYVESVRTGNLLFLTGMLPTEGHEAKFVGRVGAELDVEAGHAAARLAAIARSYRFHIDAERLRGSQWLLQAISAITRESLTVLQNFYKTSLAKIRTLVGWCMASQAFHLVVRSR